LLIFADTFPRGPDESVAAEDASVSISIRDSVLLIQLSSTDRFPRLTRGVLADLHDQIQALNANASLSGAVIIGADKCFCAGAELNEVAALDATEALRFAVLGQKTMQAIERSAKPIVAAISGYCMGGGFDLALACGMRVASPEGVFGHRGATLGIMTGWGGTQRLPRMLGAGARSATLELMATGRTVGADEALAMRIISRIVPRTELVEVAARLAQSVRQ
jgi:enoyl-CoA hydratase